MWWEVYLSPPEPRLPGPGFTLEDFMRQLDQVRRLRLVDALSSMTPDVNWTMRETKTGEADMESQAGRMKAIYSSMTKKERQNTDLLDGRRRRRIARGAGVDLNEVGAFMKQFETTRDMMRAVGASGCS